MKKPKPLIDEAQAYRYALWLLNRRPYSVGEIREKFRLRSLAPGLQEKVLAKLLQKKFINDEAFAEAFVHSKMNQSWGPYKIRLGLQKKKISRDLVEKSITTGFPPEQVNLNARELLGRQKRRFLRKKGKEPSQILKQACEFLVRKGYSFQAARLAVKDVFSYNSDLPPEEN